MAIFAVFVGGIFVILATVVASVWMVTRALAALNKSQAEVLVHSLQQVLGGDEPAVQLAGNEQPAPPDTLYFPPWEADELMFPEDIADQMTQEAGWAPANPVNLTSHMSDHPLPGDENTKPMS